MKKIKVYMGIPSTGFRSDFQCYVLRDIEKKYKDTLEFVYPEVCVHRTFHDFARNAIVDEFLASDCDVIWFLDSDIAPDPATPKLISEHWDKWQAAGCPYPVFMTPPGDEIKQVVFTVYNGGSERGMCPAKIPYSGLDFVDGIATGCLFVKREVFEKIPRPFFEFKYHPDTRCMSEGEDIGFCKKLQTVGIKFFIDYSLVAKHYKEIELLETNNYAMDYARKAVEAYDAQIREKVQYLANKVRTLEQALKSKNSEESRGVAAPQVNDSQGQVSPLSQPHKSKLILPPGYGSPSLG